MLGTRPKVRLETERLTLRPPLHGDFRAWAALRQESADFLTQWEPTWADDHLSRRSFTNRVYWAQRSIRAGTAVPLFLIRRADDTLLGAITLDNIRRGPRLARRAGKMRLQVRRCGAKLSADRRALAQPCALCQPAQRPARADGCGLRVAAPRFAGCRGRGGGHAARPGHGPGVLRRNAKRGLSLAILYLPYPSGRGSLTN